MNVSSILAALCFCLMASIASATETVKVTEIERFTGVVQGDQVPLSSSEWKTIQLPLRENPEFYETMQDYEVSWFRISNQQMDGWMQPVLYIWRHNVRAGVFVDGRYVGGTLNDPDSGRINISWNHPLLIDLPVQSSADIYIRLDAGPGGTILSPLLLGEKRQLTEIYEQRHFFQIELSFWLFVLCGLLSGLSLWLWLQRQGDNLYLNFSALSFLSAVTTSFFFFEYTPIGMHAWLMIQHASSALVLIFVIRFTLDALELDWPRVKRYALPAVLLVTSSYLWIPAYYLQPTAYLLSLLLATWGMGLGVYVMYLTVKQPTGTRLWFSAAFAGLIILQAHDIYYAFLSPPEVHIGASNWMQLSTPLFALAFFAHLVHRFTHALEESEMLNRTLEARVAATTEALQQSYQKNREIELENRANEERTHIYQALHDDLGSKLISIVHTAEDPKQMTLARGALESLRESIYKASHPIQDLQECLANICEEAELRLTSAGKQFGPNMDLSMNCDVAPGLAYNLTRIFREAVSNVLQHSGSHQVGFGVSEDENQILIELIDDGSGRVGDAVAAGGIANMHFRAERIGATLSWRSVETGSCLQLSLPKASLVAKGSIPEGAQT